MSNKGKRLADNYVKTHLGELWGVHPESFREYAEVYRFLANSKTFIETGNNPQIGLGYTIISKRSERVEQYGSGEVGYSLLDFLMTAYKLSHLKKHPSFLFSRDYYSINISKINNSSLLKRYLLNLLNSCPVEVYEGDKFIYGYDKICSRSEFMDTIDRENIILPSVAKIGVLDFLFYNSLYSFCEVELGEEIKEGRKGKPLALRLERSGNSVNSNADQLEELRKLGVKYQSIKWTLIRDFEDFSMYAFYAAKGLSINGKPFDDCNDNTIFLNKKTKEVFYFNSFNSVRAEYLSTYLFVDFQLEKIRTFFPDFSPSGEQEIVISEILEEDLLFQYLLVLKAKFVYSEGDPQYSASPEWNWNYYKNDEERLKRKLEVLPVIFQVDDIETLTFFLHSNLEKKFCRLTMKKATSA